MGVIVRAEATHRHDPWITHSLRLLAALVVVVALGSVPMAGPALTIGLLLGLFDWVGYRARDALFLLIPVWNVILTVKVLWRLTALNVYWVQRPGLQGRTIFREWPSRVPEGVPRPGYWRVVASIDEMDERSNFLVPMTEDAALAAVQRLLPDGKRVHCEVVDGEVHAHTTNHTPAYAWVGFVPLLFARRDEYATVVAEGSPHGTLLKVRGRLDTGAAGRVRALRVAA